MHSNRTKTKLNKTAKQKTNKQRTAHTVNIYFQHQTIQLQQSDRSTGNLHNNAQLKHA